MLVCRVCFIADPFHVPIIAAPKGELVDSPRGRAQLQQEEVTLQNQRDHQTGRRTETHSEGSVLVMLQSGCTQMHSQNYRACSKAF